MVDTKKMSPQNLVFKASNFHLFLQPIRFWFKILAYMIHAKLLLDTFTKKVSLRTVYWTTTPYLDLNITISTHSLHAYYIIRMSYYNKLNITNFKKKHTNLLRVPTTAPRFQDLLDTQHTAKVLTQTPMQIYKRDLILQASFT